jgi:Asp-tRNA(Asn)/Glu-tRNA(Gln) amidotransferase A subunit family amidase
VLEVNPDADEIARSLDRERRDGWVRGPLHGIPVLLKGNIDTAETDGIFENALDAMQNAGATLVDPADLPTMADIGTGAAEVTVLVYEFKRDLNAYLATRSGVPISTLADAIAFNEANAERELKWFLQEWFELAESDPFDEATYLAALAEARRLGGADGIDAVLAQHNLHALVAPTGSPAWPNDLVNGDHFQGASSAPAAIAGYPIINVPAGDAFGLPVGISFMSTAWSEPTLIRLALGVRGGDTGPEEAGVPRDAADRRAPATPAGTQREAGDAEGSALGSAEGAASAAPSTKMSSTTGEGRTARKVLES